MARGRLLAQSLSTSQKFAALYDQAGALAEFCQVVFALLVAHADECGRQPGDAWTVKYKVLPGSPRNLEEFDRALDALERVGLVQRYTVDARRVLAITQFQAHQALRHPPQSTLPPPPGTPPDPAPADPSRPGMSGHGYIPGQHTSKGREGKGREEKKERARARALLPAVAYLDACKHDPRCETPHLCGRRRQLAAAVRRGELTAAQGERLEQLWLLDRQMVRATVPRAARKTEAS